MDANAEIEISKHLDSRESLKWVGAPRQGLLLRGSDAFLVPFSLVWGGFAIFWEVGVISSGAPFFFMLWGIPFVLVGLYLIAGRFFLDARVRAGTIYGLTDQRAITISGLFSRSVNSLSLTSMSELTLTEKADRSGTITFGRPNPLAIWSGGMQWPGMAQYQTPAFEMIPNARSVHDQIREAQRSAA